MSINDTSFGRPTRYQSGFPSCLLPGSHTPESGFGFGFELGCATAASAPASSPVGLVGTFAGVVNDSLFVMVLKEVSHRVPP